MSRWLEKPILRTLPVFYAQATATRMRRLSFGVMLASLVLGSALEAASMPVHVGMRMAVFLLFTALDIWIVAGLAFAWDVVVRFFTPPRL